MDRQAHCALCACAGYHADTDAGEVVIDGRPDPGQQAPEGATILMAGREDGSDTGGLYCADCARCTTPVLALHRLMTVHGVTRQQTADACGVSGHAVHSWLRTADDDSRREMPERHLDLFRLRTGF